MRGGAAMTFDEILAQVLDLLQREKRLSYRALKVRFGLDDEHLAALKDEIVEAKQLAVDDRGVVLVWTGDGAPAPPATASTPARVSLATMPAYLAEKIRTTSNTLTGEHKQVRGLHRGAQRGRKGSTASRGGRASLQPCFCTFKCGVALPPPRGAAQGNFRARTVPGTLSDSYYPIPLPHECF